MLKAAGSGSEREVLFRLKAIPDKDNPRAFRGLAEEALKSQKAIDDGVREGTRVRKREYDQHVKDHRKAIVEIEREEDRQHHRHRERQRSIAQQNRKRREDEARENEKALKEADRERQRLLDRGIREAKQAAREKERAERQAINARMREERTAANERERIARQEAAQHQRTLNGMKQIMGSSIQLGRAFAMSGLLGEESMQKMLDTLIKIQIATDLARGGISMAEGLGKMAAGGAAVGGATMAGGIAAAGALASLPILAATTDTGANATAGAYTWLAGLGVGMNNRGRNESEIKAYDAASAQRDTWYLGPYRQAARAEARTNRMEKWRAGLQGDIGRNEQLGARDVDARRFAEAIARENRQLDLQKRFGDDPLRMNAELMDDARARANRAGGVVRDAQRQNSDNPFAASRVSDTAIMAAMEDQVAAYEEQRDIKREEAAITERMHERNKASIRETIAGYAEQLELKKQEAKAINRGAVNQLLRIDAADPMQRARGLAALEKLDRGENLSREELPFIEQFGTAEEQRKAQENRAAQVQDPLADRVRNRQAADLEKNRRQQENLDEVIGQQSELYLELQSTFKEYTENSIKAIEGINAALQKAKADLKQKQDELTGSIDNSATEVGNALRN